jgi:hypothetical protein
MRTLREERFARTSATVTRIFCFVLGRLLTGFGHDRRMVESGEKISGVCGCGELISMFARK